jgi:HD-GYP domain-containing protein (c-di-GMP phosphodiesterase class II)
VEMTLGLARICGVTEADLVHIRRGALLHDIGKMGLPDSILLKPSGLSAEEWVVMRQHPMYAYRLLNNIPYLRAAMDIPYSHHESWDGSGYPRGLKGEEIPLAARIFAVVDVWDALLSERPYRPAWPNDDVRRYLRSQSRKQFDPRIVDLFLDHLQEYDKAKQ